MSRFQIPVKPVSHYPTPRTLTSRPRKGDIATCLCGERIYVTSRGHWLHYVRRGLR